MLRELVTDAALLSTGALFGASLYDTVVLAPNLRGGPQGLEHGRLFLSRATPGNLFRVAAPLAQVLLLAARSLIGRALRITGRSPQRSWRCS